MRSKGSRFTLGVWGLRVFARRCPTVRNLPQPSATVRIRSQPFATVRNRSQPSREGRMAVPMVSSAKGVTFGGFTCGVASFRVAGVALSDIQKCFVTCRKSFCVAGAILLRRFPKMSCGFRGTRSILEISVVILCGRCSISDVSHCLLYTPHSALHTPPFTLHLPLFTFHTLNSTL